MAAVATSAWQRRPRIWMHRPSWRLAIISRCAQRRRASRRHLFSSRSCWTLAWSQRVRSEVHLRNGITALGCWCSRCPPRAPHRHAARSIQMSGF